MGNMEAPHNDPPEVKKVPVSLPENEAKKLEGAKNQATGKPELSEGDKTSLREWKNPSSREALVAAGAKLRLAKPGTDDRITYEVIKDTIKRLTGDNFDAHIDEYNAKKSADATLTKNLQK